MDFAVFILVNAALLIRPGEIIPPLSSVPVYQMLILLSLAVSLPKLIAQWTTVPLSQRPVSACILGLLAAVVLSHLVRGDVGMARYWGTDFARVALYCALFVSLVDTPGRLRSILLWIMLFIAVIAVMAISQNRGWINVPALAPVERKDEDPETGEFVYTTQMVGTGIFNDPNDFSVILAFACIISLFFANDRRFGPLRFLWLGFTALFVHSIMLTQSRGGFLALAFGLGVFLASLVGVRRTIVAATVAIPLLLPLLGGRLARMSASEGTAQQRIELWRESMVLFRSAPLFGIGVGKLAEEIGLVAHNSYVHAYAEMGFLGGTSFLGAFLCAGRILIEKGRTACAVADRDLRRVHPYLLSMLTTFAFGLFSLTRCYVATTYICLSLAEAYQNIALPPNSRVVITPKFLLKLLVAGVMALVGINLFIRVFSES